MADAKYRQIADDLRDQITAGTLPPGSQLPTEPKLAAAYGASRSTVRLAIGLLIQQGLVETRQGVGTYVTEPVTPLTVVLSREEDWRPGRPRRPGTRVPCRGSAGYAAARPGSPPGCSARRPPRRRRRRSRPGTWP